MADRMGIHELRCIIYSLTGCGWSWGYPWSGWWISRHCYIGKLSIDVTAVNNAFVRYNKPVLRRYFMRVLLFSRESGKFWAGHGWKLEDRLCGFCRMRHVTNIGRMQPLPALNLSSSLRPLSEYCKIEMNIYDLTICQCCGGSTLTGNESWATWLWGACVQLPCDLQWVLQSTHDFPPRSLPWCVLCLPPCIAFQLSLNEEKKDNWLWCSLTLIPGQKCSVFQ
jgi:hypothetical protein